MIGRRARRRVLVLAVLVVATLVAWLLSLLGGDEDSPSGGGGVGNGQAAQQTTPDSGIVDPGASRRGGPEAGEDASPAERSDPTEEEVERERKIFAALDLLASMQSFVPDIESPRQLADLEADAQRLALDFEEDPNPLVTEALEDFWSSAEEAWPEQIEATLTRLDQRDPRALHAEFSALIGIPKTAGSQRLERKLIERGLRLPRLVDRDDRRGGDLGLVDWPKRLPVWSPDIGLVEARFLVPFGETVTYERPGESGLRFGSADCVDVLPVEPTLSMSVYHGIRCGRQGRALYAAVLLAQVCFLGRDQQAEVERLRPDLEILRSVFATW